MNNKYRSKVNALLGMVTPILLAVSVRADGFADSSVATGTLALVRDVTAWVTVLCPLVCGLVAIYFAIRKGMADEQDAVVKCFLKVFPSSETQMSNTANAL